LNGSPVRITNDDAWGENTYRRGHVFRIIGRLEEQSRLAQVLVEVQDPLGRSKQKSNKPRLILGSFVELRIKGRELQDVAVIDPAYVREDDTVWVMNEQDRLEIRDVALRFRGQDRAYVASGLKEGDQVVTTNLSAPVADMRLRTSEPSTEGSTAIVQDEEPGHE